jgi:pimeloyl-ACP methyl ester carboxylesterase
VGYFGRSAGIEFFRREAVGSKAGQLPFVLLHGIGSNATSWRSTIDALPSDIETIAWHAPGYGSSDAISRPDPSPSDYADALDRLLDTLRIGRVVLVGHSLGSLFAGRYAATRHRRVAGLALLSPALGYAVPTGKPLLPPLQARVDELNALGAEEFAARRAGRLVYRSDAKPDVLAAVREAMSCVQVEGYAQAVRALNGGDLIADAPLIQALTSVAVGAEDEVTPPANAERLHAVLRRPLSFTKTPGAGHALPQEAPTQIARILTTLMEAIRDD